MIPVPPPAVNSNPPAIVIPWDDAAPRLSDLLVPPTYRVPTDAEMPEPTAADLDSFAAYLSDLHDGEGWWLDEAYANEMAEQDACEIAARRDEEADSTPPGIDCQGFTLGSIDSPNDPIYVADPSLGMMFAGDPAIDDAPAYW